MDLGCVISSRHVFGIMPCLHEVLKAEVRKREQNSSAFLGPYLSSYEVHKLWFAGAESWLNFILIRSSL